MHYSYALPLLPIMRRLHLRIKRSAQARMNGGTNIALSIKQAGQLLKHEDPDAARIIVLLTDGRVDGFQGGFYCPAALLFSCVAGREFKSLVSFARL
jgi:Mg-chelatase subunit ChlD